MHELDKGHRYSLLVLDQSFPPSAPVILTFVKREGPGFPGNEGSYPGTINQDVLRVLVNRLSYLQNQHWSLENVFSILLLQVVIWLHEFRAARRHGFWYTHGLNYASSRVACSECGHTMCGHRDSKFVKFPF